MVTILFLLAKKEEDAFGFPVDEEEEEDEEEEAEEKSNNTNVIKLPNFEKMLGKTTLWVLLALAGGILVGYLLWQHLNSFSPPAIPQPLYQYPYSTLPVIQPQPQPYQQQQQYEQRDVFVQRTPVNLPSYLMPPSLGGGSNSGRNMARKGSRYSNNNKLDIEEDKSWDVVSTQEPIMVTQDPQAKRGADILSTKEKERERESEKEREALAIEMQVPLRRTRNSEIYNVERNENGDLVKLEISRDVKEFEE